MVEMIRTGNEMSKARSNKTWSNRPNKFTPMKIANRCHMLHRSFMLQRSFLMADAAVGVTADASCGGSYGSSLFTIWLSLASQT